MAAVMTGKRKREDVQTKPAQVKKSTTKSIVTFDEDLAANEPEPEHQLQIETNGNNARKPPTTLVTTADPDEHMDIQIVAGSYDRVLHGISASIPTRLLQKKPGPEETTATTEPGSSTEGVTFSDAFLFAGHSSSIRCLAISPQTESDKRILATGSSDERINLYNLSTAPPSTKSRTSTSSLLSTTTNENSRNRSLGNLIHHDRAVTCLHFPARSKLFSAAEDNTIAVCRTRDWTVLSSIKAPIPKPQGRPSGDTAGPGEIPAGVNDFAIHPSQKLMLSVGRGEKCMRLWNLMTGKKAGVLNFERELLAQAGEGKFSSGEGRRVLWNETGETYVVGFERGAVVFGIDSKPKAIIRPSPPTKLHQMRFLPQSSGSGASHVLAVSTEDGRVLLFDSQITAETSEPQKLAHCPCIAQLGGTAAGISGRIKDFDILELPGSTEKETPLLIVTASSDGAIRLWTVFTGDIAGANNFTSIENVNGNGKLNGASKEVKQVENWIGTVATGNRITCLGAFVLNGKPAEDDTDGPDGFEGFDDDGREESSEDDVVDAQI